MISKHKQWYIHIVEYHLIIKRDKLLIHTATCMNPKCIMLNERSKSQRDRLYTVPLTWLSGKGQTRVAENRSVLPGGGGRFNYKEASSTRECERCWVILYSVHMHVLKLIELHAPKKILLNFFSLLKNEIVTTEILTNRKNSEVLVNGYLTFGLWWWRGHMKAK